MSEKNYYKILQIDPSAEPEVVQAAFRRLAQKYHPDANGSSDATRRMQELNEAYDVLCDPAKRAAFDRQNTSQMRQTTEYQRQAEYESQEQSEAAEQKRKQEETRRSAEQRPRGNFRLTLTEGVSMDFIHVPAGKFLMGSPANNRYDDVLGKMGYYHDERPQYVIEIPYNYWISRYPVTNKEFARFVTATRYRFNQGQWQTKASHPVVLISWWDAMAYCQWLNSELRDRLRDLTLRLPTEAEWEKAARGTQGNEWPWGNVFDKSKCNTEESRKSTTTSVGLYSPYGDSPYGVADMAGNVGEWCHSLKKAYPYRPNDGRESESDSGVRVWRGGAFDSDQYYARCTCRDGDRPDYRDDSLGFRCILSPGSRS
jgi:toxoflavin biosynthesis protein ToxD